MFQQLSNHDRKNEDELMMKLLPIKYRYRYKKKFSLHITRYHVTINICILIIMFDDTLLPLCAYNCTPI